MRPRVSAGAGARYSSGGSHARVPGIRVTDLPFSRFLTDPEDRERQIRDRTLQLVEKCIAQNPRSELERKLCKLFARHQWEGIRFVLEPLVQPAEVMTSAGAAEAPFGANTHAAIEIGHWTVHGLAAYDPR